MIPKRVGDGCAGFCSLFSFTRCVGGTVIDREAQFVAKGSPVYLQRVIAKRGREMALTSRKPRPPKRLGANAIVALRKGRGED
jgi:hypothetical protein